MKFRKGKEIRERKFGKGKFRKGNEIQEIQETQETRKGKERKGKNSTAHLSCVLL